MSRYQEWTKAYNGILQYVLSLDIEPKHITKVDKIINQYCKLNNIKGSFSERVLLITTKTEWIKLKEYIDKLI